MSKLSDRYYLHNKFKEYIEERLKVFLYDMYDDLNSSKGLTDHIKLFKYIFRGYDICIKDIKNNFRENYTKHFLDVSAKILKIENNKAFILVSISDPYTSNFVAEVSPIEKQNLIF